MEEEGEGEEGAEEEELAGDQPLDDPDTGSKAAGAGAVTEQPPPAKKARGSPSPSPLSTPAAAPTACAQTEDVRKALRRMKKECECCLTMACAQNEDAFWPPGWNLEMLDACEASDLRSIEASVTGLEASDSSGVRAPPPSPASCTPTEPDRDLDPLTPTGVPRHRLSPMTAQTPELVSFPKGSGDSTIGGEQSLHRSATYESPLPRGWTPPSSPSPATMLSPGFQAERARLERDLAAYLGMEQLSDNIPVATTPSSTGTPLSTARSLESQLWSDTLPEMEPLPERDTLPRGTLPEMEPLPTNIAGLLNANLAGTLGEDSGGAETPRSKRQRLCDDVFLGPLEEESPEDLNSESSAEPNSEHTEEPTGDTEEHTMEHTEEPTGDTEEQYAPRITEDTMEPTEEQYRGSHRGHRGAHRPPPRKLGARGAASVGCHV